MIQHPIKNCFDLSLDKSYLIKKGDNVFIYMPYRIIEKSNKPIYEYHVGMAKSYLTPHYNRIDANRMNSSLGFHIPFKANYTMLLTKNQCLTFHPITEGYVYQGTFKVYVKSKKNNNNLPITI